MMAVAKREEEDQWVAYEWRQGDVGGLHLSSMIVLNLNQDQAVLDKVDSLLVSEEKKERLECSTTGLDYLNRQ